MRSSTLSTTLALATGALILGTSATASADFGSQGQLSITAERLFGVSMVTDKEDNSRNDRTDIRTDKYTVVSLFGGPGGVLNPYTLPHVGVHYTVIPSLTVGAGLGIASIGGTNERERTNGQGVTETTKTDLNDVTMLFLAPRVGYVLGLTPAVGLWLRGGLTYYSISSKYTDETVAGTITIKREITSTNSGLGLNLDPMFVISPVDHFGFMVGPTIDIPLSGTDKREEKNGSTTETVENDHTFMNLGLTVGLVGYF